MDRIMKSITFFTDGGAQNKDVKYGAWAFVIRTKDKEIKKHVLNNHNLTVYKGYIHRKMGELQGVGSHGTSEVTTNNKMELTSIQQACEVAETVRKQFGQSVKITIVTDSMYCINALSKWAYKWKANNWQRPPSKYGNTEPLKNIDIIQPLFEVVNNNDIVLCHVKGHSGNYSNELCDMICSREISKMYL